jgi:putative heme-binding domain-containing protein
MKLRLLGSLSLITLCHSVSAAPQWIWSSKDGTPSADFRKSFAAPAGLKSAVLEVSCDNEAEVELNGRKIVSTKNWQQAGIASVLAHLKTDGPNELLVHGKNEGSLAGLLVRIRATAGGGPETVLIETDGTWEARKPGAQNWTPAVVIGEYGRAPWGKVLETARTATAAKNSGSTESIAASEITVPPGFKVEKLYNVPKEEQGSWVALTVDPKGRLLACDQYGALYRMTPPGSGAATAPERLSLNLGKAHGLLAAFDSLYVMVNEDGKNNGLYRATDSDRDGEYDTVTKLHTMVGSGEHGLHSMVLSPDGKRIFFNCGNHTQLPEGLVQSRAAKIWAEDHVLPRMWDANGHARGILAPGGYVCSMNPDGTGLELFCSGFRNEFDICFNNQGQLFTYDADMEWDIGSPWYRPTRVNHCVSGADYGWRSGSGKWPNYYPDNLPTTLDIGPGSPTGVVSGTGAKFPAKYQHAIFINDWTYGTMWAVHLQPKGASYSATREEFVFGKPLPLTDVVIHPQDGAMYFAVGGRRTQSGLYRVTYTGAESTAPEAPAPLSEEFKLRESLEALHTEGTDPSRVLAQAWPHLGHADRHIRYAARVAIERLPAELWREKALTESHPDAALEALVALARVSGNTEAGSGGKPAGGKSAIKTSSSEAIQPVAPANVALENRLLNRLAEVDTPSLSQSQQLAALRALQLVLIRLGKPDADTCGKIAARLEKRFPSNDSSLDRELCQTLVAVDSRAVVPKALGLLGTVHDDFTEIASDAVLSRNDGYANAARAAAGSRPNAQQIAFMFALRNATAGWTPELRRTFFGWFPRARQWKGGNSFKGFIENIRKEALANFAPESERVTLETLSTKEPAALITNFVAPKGPGKAYTVDEALQLVSAPDALKSRNFAQGEAMFRSTLCATCHRFNGEGGSIGPDLTGSGNRYTLRDLLENIIDPSKVISDQYDSHEITLKNQSIVLGRIVVEENDKLFVVSNPFAPADQTVLNSGDVLRKEVRKVSMMPPGLVNSLNSDELRDLVAYLLSGGNPKDKAFAP